MHILTQKSIKNFASCVLAKIIFKKNCSFISLYITSIDKNNEKNGFETNFFADQESVGKSKNGCKIEKLLKKIRFEL